jgi:hypothetical protein
MFDNKSLVIPKKLADRPLINNINTNLADTSDKLSNNHHRDDARSEFNGSLKSVAHISF